MDLVLITTYIERRQDDELREIAEELKVAGIKRSELLRTCLALGLDAVRELVPEVLAEVGVSKVIPPGSRGGYQK